jgi:cytochrome c peroxidase
VGIRERIRLKGKGPRGIAFAGNTLLATEYFSGTLAVIGIEEKGGFNVESISIGEEPPMSVVRAGESLFHDASVCFQQWQSCASCHPGDARVDALNWDILNDGMGNPKNTKNMLLSYDTPPTTITGVRPNAEASTRAGIRFMLFNKLPEEDAISIDEYLKSLKPVPSPKLVGGELSDRAKRGKIVFDTADCGRCHPTPLFTDMNKHRVGTNTPLEPERGFDTPTLIEVWRTAPYLHDGRAITMREIFDNKSHGETDKLSEDELDDLAEYVLSL